MLSFMKKMTISEFKRGQNDPRLTGQWTLMVLAKCNIVPERGHWTEIAIPIHQSLHRNSVTQGQKQTKWSVSGPGDGGQGEFPVLR